MCSKSVFEQKHAPCFSPLGADGKPSPCDVSVQVWRQRTYGVSVTRADNLLLDNCLEEEKQKEMSSMPLLIILSCFLIMRYINLTTWIYGLPWLPDVLSDRSFVLLPRCQSQLDRVFCGSYSGRCQFLFYFILRFNHWLLCFSSSLLKRMHA